MNVRSIPEQPLCAPALRMVVARSMTREAKYPRAGTSFAAWIANRWSPFDAARLSPPHMMFRRDRKSGATSVTIRNFLSYGPRLTETSSLQLEFFRSYSLLVSQARTSFASWSLVGYFRTILHNYEHGGRGIDRRQIEW